MQNLIINKQDLPIFFSLIFLVLEMLDEKQKETIKIDALIHLALSDKKKIKELNDVISNALKVENNFKNLEKIIQ